MSWKDLLIHPMFVHFPIAFYFLEILLLSSWIYKKQEVHYSFAALAFKLGFFFMLLAAAAGVYDAGGFDRLFGMKKNHVISALIVIVIYSVRAMLWRFFSPRKALARWVLLLTALAGYFAVLVAAYFGGELVYG